MGDGGSLVGRAKALYLILFNLLSVGLWVAVLSITVSTITNELLLKGQDIAQVSLKVHAGAGPFIRFAQSECARVMMHAHLAYGNRNIVPFTPS